MFPESLFPESLILLAQQTPHRTIWQLFADAGPMAYCIFGLLVSMSIGSWAIMLRKITQYKKAREHGKQFLDVFRRSRKFSEVNKAASALYGSPMVGLFQAGYAEIDSQVKAAQEAAQAGAPAASFRVKSLEAVERSLRRAIGVELEVLGRGQPFLATVAAASPFIGLFGTVWGIMVAFQDIGATGSSSITAVAPGIAEALINTAAGLASAIPAMVGFNYFGSQLKRMRSQMEDFVLEFLNLTERNFT